MSNPGKAIAGLVVTAAGVALTFAPIPGAQIAGSLLAMYGTGLLTEGVIGGPDATGEGVRTSSISTQAALPVVYGQRKISHYVADIRTHGTDNSWLDVMTGLCLAGESGKGIESIESIWLYKDEKSTNGPLTLGNTSSTGQTTAVIPRYYDSGADQWYYLYNIGLGADNQATDARMATLFPAAWGVSSGIDHQEGRGIVTCMHGFFWDKREEDPIWGRGRPTDIRYIVRGNLVYDPRYKTSGPDSDGWIWDRADNGSLGLWDNHPGENPALQILDYLTSKRYGVGVPYAARGVEWGPDDEIDEASFIAMANHCDEDVTTTGLDTNITIPRYTSDVVISTGDSHKSNLERLLSACNGMLVYEGNKYKLLPRKVQTPVSYEIDESQLIGDIEVMREGASVPNIITVRYPSWNHDYELVNYTWPIGAFDDSQNGYLEADNNVPNEVVIDLPATTFYVNAQHLAMTLLREMREDVVIGVTCRESAIQLSVGDVVNVTYDSAGWSQKPFRVVGMELNNDNTIGLQLKEYADSVYSLDPNEDIPTVPGTDLPNPFTVTAPTAVASNCAAGYYLTEGAFIPRVEVTWTASTDAWAKEEELVYKRNADTDWIFTGIKKKIGDTTAIAWEGDLDIGVAYDFGVVAWNHLSIRSAVAEASGNPCTITGPGETPSDVTISSSSFTCLEGINLTFDNPAVYTDANSVGVIEIGFYAIEIREQGAGATELDRWNNGTWIETIYGTEWNYPFDKLTKGTYDLSVRRIDKYGAYATTPTEVSLTLSAYPCTGFGEYDPEQLGSIILNGDFENGFSYWYSDATARTSLETVSPIGGAASLKITAAGGSTTSVFQTNDPADDETSGGSDLRYVPTYPGEIWTAAALGYTSSTNQLDLYFNYYDEDKVSVSSDAVLTWDENTATLKRRSSVVPDGAYYMNVEFRAAAGTGDCYVDNSVAISRQTDAPVAFYDIVHNGGSPGTATVTVRVYDFGGQVIDFDMRIWDVGTQAWGAWVDDSDASVTVTAYNTYTTDYSWDITLDEKHDTYTEYDVLYITMSVPSPTPYIETAHLRQVVTLDVDTVPEFVGLNVNVDNAGNCELHWALDDDGQSIRYTKSTISYADAGDPVGSPNIENGTTGVATIHTGLAFGDTLYVRAIPYSGATGTGDPGTKEVKDQVTNLDGATYPIITEEITYTGTPIDTGVLTLNVEDPDTRITQVEFATKVGVADWGSYSVDSPPAPYSTTVAMTEKHNSGIKYKVTFTNLAGTNSYIEGGVTFDSDTNPEFMSQDIDIDVDGDVEISWTGDDDTLSIKYTKSTDDYATAGDPTGGTALDGRNDVAEIHTGLAQGDTLYVRMIPYSGANGTGTAGSQEAQVKITNTNTTDGQGGVEILNGNFENFFAYWISKRTSDNGTTLSPASSGEVVQNNSGSFSPLEGSYDCRIESRTDSNEVRLYASSSALKAHNKLGDPRNFVVAEGDVIKMSALMYNSSLSGPDGGFGVQWYNSSDTIIQTDEKDYGGVADEKFTLTTAAAPLGTTYCRIYLFANASAASSGYYVYFDAVTAAVSQVAQSDMNELNDVDYGVGPNTGDTLSWNAGGYWEPVTGGAGGALGDLSNVTDASDAAGWFLRSTGAATWASQLGVAVSDVTNAADLTAVNTFQAGQVINAAAPTLEFQDTIDSLSDVGPRWKDAGGQLEWSFRFDGNDLYLYNNNGTPTANVKFALATNVTEFNQRPTHGGDQLAAAVDDLDFFNDVTYTTAPQSGEYLVYNGTVWEPGAGASTDNLSDIGDVATGYADGDLLYYNTNTWQGNTPAELNLAQTNVSNTFTAAQTINAASPALYFQDTVDAADQYVGPSWLNAAGTTQWSWRFDGTNMKLWEHNGTPAPMLTFNLAYARLEFHQRPTEDGYGGGSTPGVPTGYAVFSGDDLDEAVADVTYTTAPQNGEALIWATDHWEPGDVSVSSSDLGDLNNVTDASSGANWYLSTSAAGVWFAENGVPFSNITGTVDADTLDTYDSTAFPRKAEAASISGKWTYTDNPIIDGGSDAGWIDYEYGISTSADKIIWMRSMDGTSERWGWRLGTALRTHTNGVDTELDDLYLVRNGSTATPVIHFDYNANSNLGGVEFAHRPRVDGTTVALTTDAPAGHDIIDHDDFGSASSGDLLYYAGVGNWIGQTTDELNLVQNNDISVQENNSHKGYLGGNHGTIGHDIDFIDGTNTSVTVTDAGTRLTVKVDATLSSLSGTGDVNISFDSDNNSSGNFFRVRHDGTPTGGTVLFELDELGRPGFLGTRLSLSVTDPDTTDGDAIYIDSDGTYASFWARGGQHLQLRTANSTDEFYLYDGTNRDYITPLFGFATGTGAPTGTGVGTGAIYLRHEA